jgi:uncharacterized repeat protein (TIGR03806 family)
MRIVDDQWSIIYLLFAILLVSCSGPKQENQVIQEEELSTLSLSNLGLPKLSDYGFFKTPINKLVPTDILIPYNLNSALFSDYAFKKRFIKIPKGELARYNPSEVFEFPMGTILVKNFYYADDFAKPEEQWRIIETRLLINEEDVWKPLTYIWNNEQTEAFLDVAGKSVDVQWTHTDGALKDIKYSIPNQNQCKSCHMKDGRVMPIGLTARQLNRPIEDGNENQLQFFQTSNKLKGLPELSTIPKLADYNDQSQTIDARARGWLEVNCAHCHRPEGPAKTSGLHLMADINNPMKLGVGKAPVAAGKGSGGLLYDIVPGQPNNSILYFRVTSTDPGIMMPELGRSIIHQEGVDLIQQWIKEMK